MCCCSVWSASFDRELTVENTFSIQSAIIEEIAIARESQFAAEGREQIEKQPTDNLEAYDIYHRGLEVFKRPGDGTEDLLNCQRLYKRAVEIDPDFALAHARLSKIYAFLYVHYDHGDKRFEKMRRCAERTLFLDPNSPEGREWLNALERFCALGACLLSDEFRGVLLGVNVGV